MFSLVQCQALSTEETHPAREAHFLMTRPSNELPGQPKGLSTSDARVGFPPVAIVLLRQRWPGPPGLSRRVRACPAGLRQNAELNQQPELASEVIRPPPPVKSGGIRLYDCETNLMSLIRL